MAFFVRIPDVPKGVAERFHADSARYVNIVNGESTIDQRELRRSGYARIEPDTVSVFLSTCSYLLEEKHSLCIYDVGSNSGMYSILTKSIFSDSVHVHAFEPTPASFYWLREISATNGFPLTANQMALGNKKGPGKLFISEKSDASNSLQENFRPSKEAIDINISTIDIYAAESNSSPDFIKIDAETYDHHILSGSINYLKSNRPFIICEVLHDESHDYGTLIQSLMDSVGGYSYYFIGENGSLTSSQRISGDKNHQLRDWLFSPHQLPQRFMDIQQAWRESIKACTPEENIPAPRKDTTIRKFSRLIRRIKKNLLAHKP